MSLCVACARGFHFECSRGPHKPKKCKCIAEPEPVVFVEEEPQSAKRSRENIRDPHSTGRKRAARLYPLDRDAPCEWKGQRNCGGGRRPIVGCLDGKQTDRHHGPVKDTLRNHLGNVHRICATCHVHWHELNDLIYVEEDYRLLPHDPQPATAEELVANMVKWKTGQMGKEFELASSKNVEKGRLKLED